MDFDDILNYVFTTHDSKVLEHIKDQTETILVKSSTNIWNCYDNLYTVTSTYLKYVINNNLVNATPLDHIKCYIMHRPYVNNYKGLNDIKINGESDDQLNSNIPDATQCIHDTLLSEWDTKLQAVDSISDRDLQYIETLLLFLASDIESATKSLPKNLTKPPEFSQFFNSFVSQLHNLKYRTVNGNNNDGSHLYVKVGILGEQFEKFTDTIKTLVWRVKTDCYSRILHLLKEDIREKKPGYPLTLTETMNRNFSCEDIMTSLFHYRYSLPPKGFPNTELAQIIAFVNILNILYGQIDDIIIRQNQSITVSSEILYDDYYHTLEKNTITITDIVHTVPD